MKTAWRRFPIATIVLLFAGCASATRERAEARMALDGLEEARESLREAPSSSPDDPAPRPHESLSSFVDSHFSGNAWRDNVWEDYLTEPPVLIPIALGVGAIAASFFDSKLEESIKGTLGKSATIGDLSLGVLVVGSVANGLLAPGAGRTASDEMWTQGEAYALNFGITESLKFMVGRLRPDASSDRSSFPSGHASTAFTAATLIERNSGLALGIPAYALATLTAYSRVEAGRHFPSDVLAGAAIGTLTARVIDALHFGTGGDAGHRGIAGPPVTVDVNAAEEGGFLVGLSLQF
jgi:membrane-associated phospholipid phosphatase